MSISRQEFEGRMAKLRARMKAEGFDALIIFSDEYRAGHGTYLTGYKPINVVEESPQVVLLIGDEEPVVMMGRLNLYAAKHVVWIKDIRPFHLAKEHIPEILAPLKGRKSRVGLIGENLLPMPLFKIIKNALPDADFDSATRILQELRQIKTADELALMRRAAEINDITLAACLERIKPGMTEIQIAGICEAIAREYNADFGSATVVMAGKNTDFPAWRPAQHASQPSDYIMVDFNPSVEHYCNDGGITVLLPGATQEQRDILVAGHRTIKDVVSQLKAGLPATEIHRMMLGRMEKLGLAQYFSPYAKGLRGVGHGVGVDVVEPPNLSSDSDFLLQAGMTLAIKFDLHGMNTGGLRVEVVVHITEGGVDPLNRLVLEKADDFAILY